MLARWLYSVVFYLAIPVVLYRLHKRGKQNPAYRERKAERFGFYTQEPVEKSVWIHTVSVGELIAAQPLIEQMIAEHENNPVVITTMTPTGSDQVRAIFGDRVLHVYLPYDLPDAMNRFLDTFNPIISVVMETELWPNMIHYTSRRNIPVIVANARLSEKSAVGYGKVGLLVRPMLREISVIAAQAAPDGERFVELGLPPASLKVTGTVKFDLTVDDKLKNTAADLRACWGKSRPVLIAASTHEGEDIQVLDGFRLIQRQIENALLVIVPRHPERFESVAELIEQQGWKLARHSDPDSLSDDMNVVLGDTMGELLRMLGASDVAFIGGSLEPIGGHNMLEALAVGTPAITGPHVFNFQVVADLLAELGVLSTVTTSIGLGEAALSLLQDQQARADLAEKGLKVVADNRGAMARLLFIIRSYF
ncbi:3-deoxy-D-manno-octulosonic acid transferase [Gammaproteobacteria bacterium 45_16_T64]|nr:3-deoxy-D-manno-octulosonic acid transferase [Gammaproteobacteria bacterium 45_16_T64]